MTTRVKEGTAGGPFWENEPTLQECNTWTSRLYGTATVQASALCGDGVPGSVFAQHGNVRAVAVGGMLPAVLVVIGHAPLRERLHLLEGAGGLRVLQREDAHQLVAAGIVHLIELVARAELGADRIPQHLHDLDALLVIDAVGAADVAREILVDVGVLEVAGMRGEVDQTGGN